MNVYAVTSAMLIMGKFSGDLVNDSQIREEQYTQPLASMPDNIDALATEMLKTSAEEKNLTQEQLFQIENEIYKMLGEGAVLQRNQELKKTREEISYFGLFLSWFMKAKGLTYQQIQAKYEIDFSGSEKDLHKTIIAAASRSNNNLLGKFYNTLVNKFKLPEFISRRIYVS